MTSRRALTARPRQRTDTGVERQVGFDPGERSRRGDAHRLPWRAAQGAAELMIDGDVLEHRQIGKQRQVLEDDLNAERLGLMGTQAVMSDAVDHDRSAGVGSMNAGDDLDQGRLARAVFADQAMDLAALKRPVDPFQRDGSAEPLADVFQRKKRRNRRGG
jgi:hypothetical protein